MYKKILLAVDGSKDSVRAAKEALKVARLSSEAQIELLFVETPPQTARELLQQDPNRDPMEVLEENNIRPLEGLCNEAGVAYKLTALVGDPGSTIVQHAKEGAHDLIVIGSRGLGKVGQFFLGSVSTKVVHKAKCPVLLVK